MNKLRVSYRQTGASVTAKRSSLIFLVVDVGWDFTWAIRWNTYMWPFCVTRGPSSWPWNFSACILCGRKSSDQSCMAIQHFTLEVFFQRSSQRITTLKSKRPSTKKRRGSGKTCKTVNIVAIIFGKDKSLPETPFDEVVAGSVFILLDITRHLSTITSRPDGHSYLHG